MSHVANRSVALSSFIAVALLAQSGVAGAAETDDSSTDQLASVVAAVAPDEVVLTATVNGDGTTSPVTETSVDAPLALNGEVRLESPGQDAVTLSLPDVAGGASAVEALDGSIVYEGTNASVVVQAIPAGMRVSTVIEGRFSPVAFAYDSEPGSVAIPLEDGSLDIVSPGAEYDEILAHVDAPWALDANGVAVPTRYVVNADGSFSQVVDHLSNNYAYPIVADPTVSFGWGVYYHYNRAETKTLGDKWVEISAGGTAACAAAGTVLGTPVIGIIAGAACLTVITPIVYNASVANNSSPKKCLYVRVIPGVPIPTSGTYRDSRCK